MSWIDFAVHRPGAFCGLGFSARRRGRRSWKIGTTLERHVIVLLSGSEVEVLKKLEAREGLVCGLRPIELWRSRRWSARAVPQTAEQFLTRCPAQPYEEGTGPSVRSMGP